MPANWDLCSRCLKPDYGKGFLCDSPGCHFVLCTRCHPSREHTLWCPKHQPIRILPVLGWVVPERFLHPGRHCLPTAVEERHTVEEIPLTPAHVQALSILESSRTRAMAEVRRFAAWLSGSRLPLTSLKPLELVQQFVHDQLRQLLRHTSASRRVSRPTTPAVWIRHLCSVFHRYLPPASAFRPYLAGLRTLAPAPPPVEREVSVLWQRAITYTRARAVRSAGSQRLWVALWVVLSLQALGFRPLAALRGPLPQSRLTRQTTPYLAWEVAVHIDKDNKTGAVPAFRRRLLRVCPFLDSTRSLLPYPNDPASLTRLAAKRLQVKHRFGIRDLRSSRRDALVAAEARGIDAAAVANHRPNSKATAAYTGSLTSRRLQLSLAALTP
jgi:hypothetical protein